MIYLRLFFEFAKIGLFAVGGGMATLPFLRELGARTQWFGQQFITDMVAISESTPGPIGVNMATYVGFSTAGILGGVLATLGVILPSFIIVILVSKSLTRFGGNKYVEYAFYGLRPAVTGLIAAAAFSILQHLALNPGLYAASGRLADLFAWKNLAFFALMLFAVMKFRKSPILYIAISAVIGILFKF